MERLRLSDLKALQAKRKKKEITMPEVSRKIAPYAIKYRVTAEPPGDPAQPNVTGFIWFIFNLESTFYSCEELRKVLGIFPGSAASDETSTVSAIKFNNTVELCKLGALGQLNVTLRPVDKTKTYGNLGAEHKTSFYYVLTNAVTEVAANLRKVKINVGKSGTLYEVIPGSISEKKSKKSTPHF